MRDLLFHLGMTKKLSDISIDRSAHLKLVQLGDPEDHGEPEEPVPLDARHWFLKTMIFSTSLQVEKLVPEKRSGDLLTSFLPFFKRVKKMIEHVHPLDDFSWSPKATRLLFMCWDLKSGWIRRQVSCGGTTMCIPYRTNRFQGICKQKGFNQTLT